MAAPILPVHAFSLAARPKRSSSAAIPGDERLEIMIRYEGSHFPSRALDVSPRKMGLMIELKANETPHDCPGGTIKPKH